MTLKKLNYYRKSRAYSESVETFIKQCKDVYIKQIMIYRFVHRLSWVQVAHKFEYGSADSHRMVLNRYLKKG